MTHTTSLALPVIYVVASIAELVSSADSHGLHDPNVNDNKVLVEISIDENGYIWIKNMAERDSTDTLSKVRSGLRRDQHQRGISVAAICGYIESFFCQAGNSVICESCCHNEMCRKVLVEYSIVSSSVDRLAIGLPLFTERK